MSTYDTLHGWGNGLTTHTMYAIRATSVESGKRGYLQLVNDYPIINFDGTPFTHSNGTPIYAHILKCRDVVLTEYVDKFKDIVIYEYKEVASNDNDDVIVEKREIWNQNNSKDYLCAMMKSWVREWKE